MISMASGAVLLSKSMQSLIGHPSPPLNAFVLKSLPPPPHFNLSSLIRWVIVIHTQVWLTGRINFPQRHFYFKGGAESTEMTFKLTESWESRKSCQGRHCNWQWWLSWALAFHFLEPQEKPSFGREITLPSWTPFLRTVAVMLTGAGTWLESRDPGQHWAKCSLNWIHLFYLLLPACLCPPSPLPTLLGQGPCGGCCMRGTRQ